MKKIIVIDDEQAICDVICLILGLDGYKVQSFPTGEALLDRFKNEFHPPDVFILDYHLAGMNGLQLCRMLKEKEGTSVVPVIMVSGTPDIAPILLTGGADFFLEKPFELNDMLRIIKRCTVSNREAPE